MQKALEGFNHLQYKILFLKKNKTKQEKLIFKADTLFAMFNISFSSPVRILLLLRKITFNYINK